MAYLEAISTKKEVHYLRQKCYKPGKQNSYLRANQAITFCAWVHPRSAGRAGRSAYGGSNYGIWSILLRTIRNPWSNNIIFTVVISGFLQDGWAIPIQNCFTDQDNCILGHCILGNASTSIIDKITWWYHHKNYISTINAITKHPHLNFVSIGNQLGKRNCKNRRSSAGANA